MYQGMAKTCHWKGTCILSGCSWLLPEEHFFYSDIASVLEGVKKQKEVEWTPALESSFEQLKKALTHAPCQAYQLRVVLNLLIFSLILVAQL